MHARAREANQTTIPVLSLSLSDLKAGGFKEDSTPMLTNPLGRDERV